MTQSLPSTIELRPYQIAIANRGVSTLREHGICYLAMEVRTGKTLTALQIAHEIGAKSVLFCTKKKAISSIRADYERFNYPFTIDIINYESLHKITDSQADEFDLVIVDEAHSLGAFPKPSLRARKLRDLVGHRHLILLSGTPTPESYSQIYHQLWISWHSPFHHTNFYKWADDYVTVGKKYLYNKEINDYSKADKDAIMDVCGHLFISFSQSDAGFDSHVEEEVLTVTMKEHTTRGIAMLLKNKVLNTSQGIVMADTAVKLMQKVHQMCSGTVILDTPVGDADRFAFDDTKAQVIKDIFKNKKIAIFYKFQAELNILQLTFPDRLVYTPEQFNEAGPDKIFVSQIQSGREGINLSTADALVMYNIDFSAVSYWQARARLQTKDRKEPAKVYWIFSDGGIEQKIYAVVKKKKDYTLAYFRKDYIG